MGKKIRLKVTRLFKKYYVKRPRGNCQVLFALTELDDLVEEILSVVANNETIKDIVSE